MDGQQKTAFEAVQHLADRIRDGMYGRDDNLEISALITDLDEARDEIELL
jgi:hypothetical protein